MNHRLTSHSLYELLSLYQLNDLTHYYLKREKIGMYIVTDEDNDICSEFMFLSEATDYITNQVKRYVFDSNDEYQVLYYYNDDEKILVSDEDDFKQYIINNMGMWDGGIHNYSIHIVELYSEPN